MTMQTNQLEQLSLEELAELESRWGGDYFNVESNLLILSYSKEVLQEALQKPDSLIEEFSILNQGEYILEMGDQCYQAYIDMAERGFQYLSFLEDRSTGFEAIAYFKDDILGIGIAGSDKSIQDWVDNDARLIVPKGGLIPTQFNVVAPMLRDFLEQYAKKTGHAPREVHLTGNSLGGAVAVVGYTQLYTELTARRIRAEVLAYNSAPVRWEYLAEILETGDFSDWPGYFRGITHFINEDDLLNNILYRFIRNMETFGHVGRYLIVENKGEGKEEDILHYAKEHVNVLPLRNLTVSLSQDIGDHARNMLQGSRRVVEKNLRRAVDREISAYNRRTALLDKIRGGFLGLALGDAADSPEGCGGDPTNLSLAVAKGILKNPDSPIGPIASAIVEWDALESDGTGKTMREAIRQALIFQDFPTGAKAAHKELEEQSAGNGSLIRTLPVALFYRNLDDVVSLSGLQSNLTHFDHRAKEAAQLYAWLAFLLFQGESREEALWKIVDAHLYYGRYKSIPLEELPLTHFVPETLLSALAIFHRSKDISEGLEILESLGRDSAHAGSLAMALLGIESGLRGIPFGVRNRTLAKMTVLKTAGKLFDLRMKRQETGMPGPDSTKE